MDIHCKSAIPAFPRPINTVLALLLMDRILCRGDHLHHPCFLVVQGFYVVSYVLGLYILSLLIGFLSPQVDPEFQDGPSLPTRNSDEFRPFVRRLPEFKFWYSITKAFCIEFVLKFFSIFDLPVFWLILVFYWFMLFTLTMRKQILHMVKYKYVPFTLGKQLIVRLTS